MRDSDELLLETSTAARLLGLSGERIRQLHATGRLSARRTASGRRLFTLAEVERLAAERLAAKLTRVPGGAPGG